MDRPDFSSYSLEELFECKASIDKKVWPDRYQEILDCIAAFRQSSEHKRKHSELVFEEFCDHLQGNLAATLDDDFWGLLQLFSKKARHALPSAFDGEVCPICQGELTIASISARWRVSCEKCNLSRLLYQRHSSTWGADF